MVGIWLRSRNKGTETIELCFKIDSWIFFIFQTGPTRSSQLITFQSSDITRTKCAEAHSLPSFLSLYRFLFFHPGNWWLHSQPEFQSSSIHLVLSLNFDLTHVVVTSEGLTILFPDNQKWHYPQTQKVKHPVLWGLGVGGRGLGVLSILCPQKTDVCVKNGHMH